MREKKNTLLRDQIRHSVQGYFDSLNGEVPCDVYQFLLSELEAPLLEVVMNYADQNQTKAAKILGINRNTLRKKLEQNGLI